MKIIQILISSLCLTTTTANNRPRGLLDGASLRPLEPKERICEIEESDDEVNFKCKSKTEDGATKIKDTISYEVRSDTRGLVVEVEYEQEIETSAEETETETEYEIVFDRIIEYQKGTNSPDQAYDWENDEIVNEVLLQDWGRLGAITDDMDGIVSSFNISSSDGLVTFTFHVSRANYGEAITANKMKIDFELKSYPRTRSGTYVALLCAVESTREVEVEYEDGNNFDSDDESGKEDDAEPISKRTKDVLISFADAEASGVIPFGEYTWSNTAIARDDNMIIDVLATSPSNTSGEERIAFSFVGSGSLGNGEIYWDPEAGVKYVARTGLGSSDARRSRSYLGAWGIC